MNLLNGNYIVRICAKHYEGNDAHMDLMVYSRRCDIYINYSIGQYMITNSIKCSKSLEVIGNSSIWADQGTFM